MTPRQQLRARYPAILAHASLSYGDGWAGIMETLCERLQFHADHNGMPRSRSPRQRKSTASCP